MIPLGPRMLEEGFYLELKKSWDLALVDPWRNHVVRKCEDPVAAEVTKLPLRLGYQVSSLYETKVLIHDRCNPLHVVFVKNHNPRADLILDLLERRSVFVHAIREYFVRFVCETLGVFGARRHSIDMG